MEALFSTIVADLAVLHDAYKSAGLLLDGGPNSLGWALLGGGEDAERFRRQVLLVDAVVRQRVARLVFRRRGPRHIVVFGGNNVGKSTVVNVIAAASVAGTSPEGGHTRHAQAVAVATSPLFDWNPYAFNRFTRVAPDQLPGSGFDRYAVSPVAAGTLPDDVVLWDSPDCDSVGSSRYLAAVVEAVTAADLVVYVSSVEKYAVADLVEWLFDLSGAGIPVLQCLNKSPRKDRLLIMRKQTEEVFPAVSRRLNQPVPLLRTVALRFMTDGEEADLWGPDHPEAGELREAALSQLAAQDDTAQGRMALHWVQQHIDRVLEPARMELAVRTTWQSTTGAAVAAFVASYEAEYLTSSSVIDPFKQLNAELLELLDPGIPHLSDVIRRLRAVQRIPSDILKALWRRGVSLVADLGDPARDSRLAPELRAYANAHRALLASLTERIETERRVPRHHPFWDRLAAEWDRQVATLTDAFGRSTAAHMAKTDAEIKAAARDILQALQQRPNMLNLLRAARVSTDIGGLLIGFALPGHGDIIHDLLKDIVIAPAMLGATGYAAEFAVEGYVAQRRNEVVEKLRAEARDMATELYSRPLDAVGAAVLSSIGTLGLGQELLERIPANLQRLRQELRQ